MKIKLKDKRDPIIFRAKSTAEVSIHVAYLKVLHSTAHGPVKLSVFCTVCLLITQTAVFVDHVRKTIRSANVIGLQQGSREPEVVEWYYQYQADLTRDTAFMLGKISTLMCHSLPGQDEKRKTHFHVTVSSPRVYHSFCTEFIKLEPWTNITPLRL